MIIYVWILLASVLGVLCDHDDGCPLVELKNIKYQTTRRGAYKRIAYAPCQGDQNGRDVFKQTRGNSYLYYIDTGSWAGWQVGNTACKNMAGIIVEDNATHPAFIQGTWREYYYLGWWIDNPWLYAKCSKGRLGIGAIFGITLGVMVLSVMLFSVAAAVCRAVGFGKRKRTDTAQTEEELPPPTVYTNEAADFDPTEFVNTGEYLTAPPEYDAINDELPKYEDIYENHTTNESAEVAGNPIRIAFISGNIVQVQGIPPDTISLPPAYEEIGGSRDGQESCDNNEVEYETLDEIAGNAAENDQELDVSDRELHDNNANTETLGEIRQNQDSLSQEMDVNNRALHYDNEGFTIVDLEANDFTTQTT